MDSNEFLRRLEGERKRASCEDGTHTDLSADPRVDEALRADMGPRLDDLMGLLAWSKTEQAKLGGLEKVATIERILDGMERIAKWLETGGNARQGGDPESPPPAEYATDEDRAFRRLLLDALEKLEQGVRAMAEGKAALDNASIDGVQCALRDMEEMIKIR